MAQGRATRRTSHSQIGANSMKGLVKSSLATALALATSQAFALGLGPIQVKSGLNQPLVAEIPVLADSAVEMNELRVDLATAEDFARVGLNRGRVGVPIEFSVGTSGKQTVIKLTTKEIVREPFLDFLIQVNWPKGKLLREYTVLLDPPVAPAVVKSVKPAAAMPAAPVAETRPAPPPPAPKPAPPVKEVPPPAAPPAAKETAPPPAPKAAPAPRAVAPSAAAGEYGPVKKGENLSSIAGGLDAGADLNQVMLALLKANPKAFYGDNVNMLKSGAVLRIPSAEEIAAAGSVRAAASAIRAQNESWRDAAKPTQVNQAGGLPPLEAPAPAAKATPSGKSEHLALVPPKAGNGGEGSERPGAGSGNAKEAAEARAELARTKETLATKEQEATELKSRVKQLEDINDKGRHLISLKDSEIADLQNKLKELQAKANAKPGAAAKPELAPVAKIPDIVPVPATTKTETPAKSEATKPVEAPPVVDKVAETPKPGEPAKVEAAATPTPAPAATPAPAESTAAASTPAPPSGAVVTPLADNAPTQTATPPQAADAAKPAAPKPVVVPPAAPEQPWYTNLFNDNPYALYGAGGVLLLIGLWALSKVFGKKKGSGSVRPQFGSGPKFEAAHETPVEASDEQHEQELHDRVARDPRDINASLELLRHYYGQGDAQGFESLAENLHEHVHEDSAEWEEVRAMGEGLSPHHPLFTEAGHEHTEYAHAPVHGGFADDSVTKPEAASDVTQHFDFEDLAAHTQAPAPVRVAQEPVDFDLGHADAHGHVERPREPAHAAPAPAPVYETVSAPRASAQDFAASEDTIGTRLDLARAYLDMGDPEGARSMLDEVLAEGNATQKEEARKLLEELRLAR